MEIEFDGVLGGGEKSNAWPGAPKSVPDDGHLTERERNKMAEDARREASVFDIYRRYADNMLVAGRTPCYLNIGMKEGLPLEELFMIAVRGVAACLNDPMLVKTMQDGLEKRKNKKE